ncbi:hypothetical protein V6Z11_D05G351800 [Gossypium hirsutum]
MGGGGKEKSRGWNMLSWDRMCFSKGMGALGFRDLRHFNVALLGRQVWRLISCKDTLCFRVLSAKYFLDGDVFHPKRVDKPSFMWKSIARATSILHEGFGRNVGNGGLTGEFIRLNRREVQETKVCELLNETHDGWKERRIMEIYGDYLGDQIYKIPILHNGPDDYLIWFHNLLGFYSTKSAYSWLTLKHVGFGPHRLFWRLAWKLQILTKIRIFCWRLGHGILPMYEKISSIRREFNSMCPRCGSAKETLIHALKDCPRAKAVLIEDVARSLDKKALSNFIAVLWNIWNSRNNKVFIDTEEEAKVTWDRAAALSKDFCIFNIMEKPMIPKPVVEKGWKKLGHGVVKINFDAAVNCQKMSFGLVARDHDGFVLGGRAGVLDRNVQAEWVELHAQAKSNNLARAKNWLRLVGVRI